ncbi:type VI secretion system ImpA family N-terminal domain-containing protein [Erwinia tracheiphila]|uniref:ImpA domain-containing protein n=1 Tax=Erwinia tracheiphila TaxID=65700 RepID=A0A345CNJ4_9GAMM|nr:VasL domain-containing protein [Erwinia tracheiphila]AXF75011.1 hypothetical protein AV903_01015 [Erwinia tracheiphila]UIA82450.1 type VI secretion system ImpA family N-terminal domain-containing protein [Erwinia tracheiphila]UIA91039.1 type VI secretion system ImpA family N-terminal domain-containing protein [Erwinia tracheiphila]
MSRETITDIVIYTGGDPRNLSAFESLRQEIDKISHPLQPEINWREMELLALEIFRTNGVDLQTLSYYTLARTKRAGLAGFTEGCELLAGVLIGEWQTCWPNNEAARIEILNWFSSRLSRLVRALAFDDKSLRLLCRAERALQIICDKLQQMPLSQLPRIENLLIFVQNSVQRVEKQSGQSQHVEQSTAEKSALIWMPTKRIVAHATASTADIPAPPVKLPPHVPEANAESASHWLKSWQAFALGALCSLLVIAPIFYLSYWPLREQQDFLERQPAGKALLWLSNPQIKSYSRQLDNLTTIPVYYTAELGERSVSVARQLWPTDSRQQQVSQRWQQLNSETQRNPSTGESYSVVRQRLQQLSDELLAREKARSGLTISYLKTAIYQMQTAMAEDVPLEELLRQFEIATQNGESAPPLLLKQIDQRWNVLSQRYYGLIDHGNMAR